MTAADVPTVSSSGFGLDVGSTKAESSDCLLYASVIVLVNLSVGRSLVRKIDGVGWISASGPFARELAHQLLKFLKLLPFHSLVLLCQPPRGFACKVLFSLLLEPLQQLLACPGTRLTDFAHSDALQIKALGRHLHEGVTVLFRWRYRFDPENFMTTTAVPGRQNLEISRTRDLARQLLAQGKDPNGAKRIERLQGKADQVEAVALAQSRISHIEALQSRISVADLFERWASVELIRHKDGGMEIRRMFAKDVLPKIGHIAVEDIRKGHITEVTDVLHLTRGVERMAKVEFFSLMRQMFRFAVDRDIIEYDPSAAIRKAKIGGKDVERDRVLSEEEIGSLCMKMPDAKLVHTTESAVWIALSTCCRIGELLQARWEHVRFDKGEWLIPHENSKNGRSHTVYLSDFAVKHFEAVRTINGAGAWCFPNRDDSDHVCVKTVTKQLVDRQREDSEPMSRRSSHTAALLLPGGKWTPHDLRRTGATLMTALGVLPEDFCRALPKSH